MKKNGRNFMEIVFPCIETNETLASSAVGIFASQLNPTKGNLENIETSVKEAVTNVILHAYSGKMGKVSVRAKILDGNVLEIKVRDWGCGIFDVNEAITPYYTTIGGCHEGKGFDIMCSFSDFMDVKSTPGKGTIVTLKFKIY